MQQILQTNYTNKSPEHYQRICVPHALHLVLFRPCTRWNHSLAAFARFFTQKAIAIFRATDFWWDEVVVCCKPHRAFSRSLLLDIVMSFEPIKLSQVRHQGLNWTSIFGFITRNCQIVRPIKRYSRCLRYSRIISSAACVLTAALLLVTLQ